MLYQLDLLLSIDDATLTLSDRDNVLIADFIPTENLTRVSTKISLPNRVAIDISKISHKGNVQLIAVQLGGIKFKNDILEKLFVYRHEYGENRTVHWRFGGRVEFEFFDFSPIKYHLLMGTQI